MKKYLMIIVSVLLLIAIAAGCAGNTPADKPEERGAWCAPFGDSLNDS